MPSGRTHAKMSVVLAAGIALAWVYYGGYAAQEPCFSAWAAVGALAGVFVTPDLDLTPTYAGGLLRRHVGKWAGNIWDGFWRPYAAICRHRGISHVPIVGTATRVLYVLVMLVSIEGVVRAVMLWALGVPFRLPATEATIRWLGGEQGVSVLSGLAVTDMLHVVADMETYVKRFWRRRVAHTIPGKALAWVWKILKRTIP